MSRGEIVWREIPCAQRQVDTRWKVASTRSDFMGDGVWETEWYDPETDDVTLFERRVNEPGYFPMDYKREVLECRHWAAERSL